MSDVAGGSGGEAVGRSGGTGQVASGPPPSQRDQAVSALRALVELLEPEVGAQVRGLVEGLLPPKPVSPAPATPTHAQIVARLHGLYDTETELIREVDEVEGNKGQGGGGRGGFGWSAGEVARYQRSNFGCSSGGG